MRALPPILLLVVGGSISACMPPWSGGPLMNAMRDARDAAPTTRYGDADVSATVARQLPVGMASEQAERLVTSSRFRCEVVPETQRSTVTLAAEADRIVSCTGQKTTRFMFYDEYRVVIASRGGRVTQAAGYVFRHVYFGGF